MWRPSPAAPLPTRLLIAWVWPPRAPGRPPGSMAAPALHRVAHTEATARLQHDRALEYEQGAGGQYEVDCLLDPQRIPGSNLLRCAGNSVSRKNPAGPPRRARPEWSNRSTQRECGSCRPSASAQENVSVSRKAKRLICSSTTSWNRGRLAASAAERLTFSAS
jgi:hypothetical protein